jgi:hypothetical protein
MEKDAKINDLQEKIANRDAMIRDQQRRLAANTPSVSTLPPERLEQLFTAAHMDILGQTNSNDPGGGKGISGFRVFIRMKTDDGQIVPAAGTMTIEAFELPPAPAAPRRIGTWTFTPADMKANWYTGLGSNYFAFNCPWTSPPTLASVTFKAHFEDALTGRTLDADLTKAINLPGERAAAGAR